MIASSRRQIPIKVRAGVRAKHFRPICSRACRKLPGALPASATVASWQRKAPKLTPGHFLVREPETSTSKASASSSQRNIIAVAATAVAAAAGTVRSTRWSVGLRSPRSPRRQIALTFSDERASGSIVEWR